MLEQLGQTARAASYELAMASSTEKNAALAYLAEELEAKQAEVLAANQLDIEAGRANGLTEALLDRLLLTEARLADIIADVRTVIGLPDPVGVESDSRVLENGLRLCQRTVPVGVLGVIYEARPNVTIDIAALSLKTGNAAIMRGGKETLNSNKALVSVIQVALKKAGLPITAVQLIERPDRDLVTQLLKLDKYVDMIIPRGGSGLQQLCKEQSTIPVIVGGIGVCHLYVEPSADLDKAIAVVENAKVQRPSVCNALDTLLVDEAIAAQWLPQMAAKLAESGVTFCADAKAYAILADQVSQIREAGSDDFDQEWLSLTLGIKVVSGVDEAITHIRTHSTQHSDGILSNHLPTITRFVNAVNSAAVYVNASTRFTDGSQFGLGAEVAVSTQKLHARGPMGLEALTTYKWIGIGDNTIRQ